MESSPVLGLALKATIARLEVRASDKAGGKGVHARVDLLRSAESILELRL